MTRLAVGLLLWLAALLSFAASAIHGIAVSMARPAGIKTALGITTGIDPYHGHS